MSAGCVKTPKSRRILRDDIRAVEPFLQQRAAEGKWKIAVFMDAERMNDEAANAFLKTLEEPPGQCLLNSHDFPA